MHKENKTDLQNTRRWNEIIQLLRRLSDEFRQMFYFPLLCEAVVRIYLHSSVLGYMLRLTILTCQFGKHDANHVQKACKTSNMANES